ncbi:unnamed protein product [Eruca vesicaria subsp. sativa]|uniref:Uncharacterized protein n=1 Tax=Eruca vesicaria subsp. sativa TaxID=29727 RepID=A0ABC8JXB3_ERUVS|nr:unnamed protein product [Eruca vesicaria subsp. sativa]
MAGSGGGGGGWRDSFRGMSYDNIKGLVLAISSSLFIGASFIVEKGLKKAATTGTRVGQDNVNNSAGQKGSVPFPADDVLLTITFRNSVDVERRLLLRLWLPKTQGGSSTVVPMALRGFLAYTPQDKIYLFTWTDEHLVEEVENLKSMVSDLKVELLEVNLILLVWRSSNIALL